MNLDKYYSADESTRESLCNIDNSSKKVNTTCVYFDYCFVFKVEQYDPYLIESIDTDTTDFYNLNEKKKAYNKRYLAQNIIQSMRDAGLILFVYKSVQLDEIIVLVTASGDTLRAFADTINFKIRLDEDEVDHCLKKGLVDSAGENYIIKPININDDPVYSSLKPTQYIYGEYKQSLPIELYTNIIRERPFEDISYDLEYNREQLSKSKYTFRKNTRLKLLYLMLTSSKSLGGCNIPINKYLYKGNILGFFPLHDSNGNKILGKLKNKKNFNLFSVPIFDLQNYFGEKITLFFVFIEHITKWTLIPSLLGLIFQIYDTNYVLPIYGLCLCVWFVFMFEYWIRNENLMAVVWGTTDFEENEIERPEFVGEVINSFIDGSPMTYFPVKSYRNRVLQSNIIVLFLIIIIIGVVTSIYIFRMLIDPYLGYYSTILASILNTIQITVFNYLYDNMAYYLSVKENHRTETAFEDSLILKSFSFQFINSYSSFYYLAFIAKYLPKPSYSDDDSIEGQCGSSSCMTSMTYNLAILFCTRIFINNFVDFFLAYYFKITKFKNETEGITSISSISLPEINYYLNVFSINKENFNNYCDTAIQYGYSSLFIIALPCATLLNTISLVFKYHFTIYKYINLYQRPIITTVQDIGTWSIIFRFLVLTSIITNGGIIFFTLNTFNNVSFTTRLWLFIGFQWCLITVYFFIQFYIPDVPIEVDIQLKRAEFIIEKVVHKKPDDEMISIKDYKLKKQEKELANKEKEEEITLPSKILDYLYTNFPDCLFIRPIRKTVDRKNDVEAFDNFDFNFKFYRHDIQTSSSLGSGTINIIHKRNRTDSFNANNI